MNHPIETKGEMTMVCAWCVPESEQNILRLEGHKLSHGICRHCYERNLKKEIDERDDE